MEQRVQEVADLFRAEPSEFKNVFDASFLAQVPPPQLTGIFKSYFDKYGSVVRTRRLSGDEQQAVYDFTFTKGVVVKVTLTVTSSRSHLLSGLLLGTSRAEATTLAEISRQVAELPGHATFLAARLTSGGLESHGGHAPDQAAAIGSAFKLWILGNALEEILAGRKRWDTVVPLSEQARSLPSGKLHSWPIGAPVTLHTLSALMISESDNTATDQLLKTLGRERVEATMARMGVRDAERNRPLLSTLEMFKLKAGSDATAATTWMGLDEVGKRKYLAGPIAAMKRAHVQSWNTPRHLDQVEWFASAADLARSLMWLRDHSETGNAAVARGVLAINPGIPLDENTWPYVGFKGGSEPGVVAAAYLLRHRNGSWWTLTGAWNNPTHEVEVERFFGLLERATEILAETPLHS